MKVLLEQIADVLPVHVVLLRERVPGIKRRDIDAIAFRHTNPSGRFFVGGRRCNQGTQGRSHHATATNRQPGSNHPAQLSGHTKTTEKQPFPCPLEGGQPLRLLHLLIQLLLFGLRFANFTGHVTVTPFKIAKALPCQLRTLNLSRQLSLVFRQFF